MHMCVCVRVLNLEMTMCLISGGISHEPKRNTHTDTKKEVSFCPGFEGLFLQTKDQLEARRVRRAANVSVNARLATNASHFLVS